jgi:hypothetical protein
MSKKKKKMLTKALIIKHVASTLPITKTATGYHYEPVHYNSYSYNNFFHINCNIISPFLPSFPRGFTIKMFYALLVPFKSNANQQNFKVNVILT